MQQGERPAVFNQPPVSPAWTKLCFARSLSPFFSVWFFLDQANFSLSKMMATNLKSIEHPTEDWWQFCTSVTLVVFLKHEKDEMSTTQIWRNGDTFQAMNTSQDKAIGSFGCKSQFWCWVRQRWEFCQATSELSFWFRTTWIGQSLLPRINWFTHPCFYPSRKQKLHQVLQGDTTILVGVKSVL